MTDEWAKRTWTPLGRSDACFGVLTEDRFRAGKLDADAREAFSQTGDEHVGLILDAIRRHVMSDFAGTFDLAGMANPMALASPSDRINVCT